MGSSPDAILLLGLNGRIDWSNTAARALFGAVDGAGDAHLDGLLTESSRRRLAQDIRQTLDIEGTWRGMLDVVTGAGAICPMACTFVAHPAVEGGAGFYALTVRDVGAEAPRFAAQHHAGIMEAIAGLTGGLAHEFNNLLTVIMASTDELSADAGPTRFTPALDDITRASKRGALVIRRLLKYARRDPPRPEPCDLLPVCLELARELRRKWGAGVDIRVEPGPINWPAYVDPWHIEEILAHLAENAHAAMAGEGTLVLRLAATPGVHGAAGRMRISVADSGPGMEPDVLARAFEPLFSTHPERVGLGLSVCRDLVRRAGGSITVTAPPGRGARVDVELPRAPMQSLGLLTARQAKPRVLLVEPDDPARATLAAALRDRGFAVDAFAWGGAALDALGARLVEPALVVCGARHLGAEARAFVHAVRGHSESLPIVFATESSGPQRPLDLQSRAVRLTQRPYDVDALVGIAAEFIR